jgi:class 3 adenylate cyclase
MSEESRRIVAMLFSDIVGYTAAMGADEETAIRVVSRSREIQKKFVHEFDGRWLQEIGDGVMCSFESAVKAVGCALAIQRALQDEPDLNLAIGIHVGDVVFRKTDVGYDVFGDAVNVAARVQSVAGAGGITISERVYDDMRNRKGMEFEFLGEKQLKNVNRPIRIYNIIDRESLGDAPPPKTREGKSAAPAPSAASPLRRILFPAIGVAAVLGIAAVFLLRSEPKLEPPAPAPEETATAIPEPAAPSERLPEPEPVIDSGAEVASITPESPPPPPPPVASKSFAAARKALLGAAGPWRESAARVWTEPNPVPNNSTYTVRFEAECDCAVLIFSVDGSNDDISLLYPNPFETPRRLTAGETVEIPSSSSYSLRAVGGRGTDSLKIFVSSDALDFPPDPTQSWYATPEEPERVAELTAFLASLEGRQWNSVATELQIVK